MSAHSDSQGTTLSYSSIIHGRVSSEVLEKRKLCLDIWLRFLHCMSSEFEVLTHLEWTLYSPTTICGLILKPTVLWALPFEVEFHCLEELAPIDEPISFGVDVFKKLLHLCTGYHSTSLLRNSLQSLGRNYSRAFGVEVLEHQMCQFFSQIVLKSDCGAQKFYQIDRASARLVQILNDSRRDWSNLLLAEGCKNIPYHIFQL